MSTLTFQSSSSLSVRPRALSHASPSTPLWLQRYRQFSAVYLIFINILSVLTWELFWLQVDGDRWWTHFKYFTNWALIASSVYFARTAYVGRLEGSVSLLALEIALPFSFLSSIVYWLVIFNPSRVLHHSHGHIFLPLVKEISVHGLSFLLLFYDMWQTEIKFPKRDFRYLAVFGLIYQCFAYLNFCSTGVWIYEFLDFSRHPEQVAALYVVYAAVFFLFIGLQRMRDHCKGKNKTSTNSKKIE
jgi:hypothetical protein